MARSFALPLFLLVAATTFGACGSSSGGAAATDDAAAGSDVAAATDGGPGAADDGGPRDTAAPPTCCPLGTPSCLCTTIGGVVGADGDCPTVCNVAPTGWERAEDERGCAVWRIPAPQPCDPAADVVTPPPPDVVSPPDAATSDGDGPPRPDAGGDRDTSLPPRDAGPVDACAPTCGERVCGDDGCGGVCGVCPTDQHRCVEGACVAPRVVINEILASNDDTLDDEDGESSDWIELYNREEGPVSLEGWYLTDDPELQALWRFPAVTLDSHEILVVFASDKDRAQVGGELHADFKLSGDGEFLALVMADGETIVSSFAPAFPAQHTDISYGVAQVVAPTPLVTRGDTARFLVPTDGSLGDAWTAPEFDDSAWEAGPTGIGYELAGAPYPMDAPNLAEGRDTTQTSILDPYGSGRAVDGDDQNFTHTAADDMAPAWEVDLGGTHWLSSVELHNRQDCCLSRLRDVTVHVLDEGRAEVFTSEVVNPGNERFGRTLGDGPFRWDIDLHGQGGVLGRFVRVTRAPDPELYGTRGEGGEGEIAVLSLAEVVVRGGDSGVFTELRTDIGDRMYQQATSLYARIPFEVADPSAAEVLTLTVHHDAGYVVWLNGERVAERNAPDVVAWDAVATEERAGVLVADQIDLTPWRDRLRPGPNLLAIQGLNGALDDTDFIVLAELTARRVEDGDVAFFREPTPGMVNETAAFAGYVGDPVPNPPHGFHDGPIDVTLTSDTPGATIYYTLDATPPSAENGAVYEGPIPIAATTVIRAVALAPDYAPSAITTATYLFLDDIIAQDRAATLARGFPETWGGTSSDYGMDQRIVAQDGSDQYGGRYAASIHGDLQAIPSLSLVLPVDQLFGPDGIYTHSTQRGDEWERAASFELIYPPGYVETLPAGWEADPLGFQVDCGVRVQGGAFRRHDLTKKHSFRVAFKAIYGPSKLRYPLLGPDATDRFDTLTLRANSNDGWQWAGAGAKPSYIRDRFGRETALALGAPASHAAFFHLYVDGVYWGLYEAVERPDHSFSATYVRGDKDDWDAVSNGSASNGDMEAWNTLLDLARAGLSGDEAYLRVLGRAPDGTRDPNLPVYVDEANLIDYMLVNLYVGNTDWPHHNYWIGRHRDGADGFRFYMWDSEWSMGIRSDLNTNRIGVDNGVAVPWWAIKEHPEFRLKFADRVQRVFFHGGPLHVDPEAPAWDPAHPERNRPAARFAALAERIERALVAESARWGDQHASTPYTVDEHWRPQVDGLLASYFPQRSARVLEHFRAAGLYPATPAPVFHPFGGAVPPGLMLELEAPQGVVHYTTDGSDPRLFGGPVAPTARGGVPLVTLQAPGEAGALHVRARALHDGVWSALEEATFVVGP